LHSSVAAPFSESDRSGLDLRREFATAADACLAGLSRDGTMRINAQDIAGRFV
jgi:hypothetical protein